MNHSERLAVQVSAERAEEVTVARQLRNRGYLSATALYDWERAALRRLVLDGRADDDLSSARRYTITDAGRTWLDGQES